MAANNVSGQKRYDEAIPQAQEQTQNTGLRMLIHQSDIPPSTIKQRHLGEGNRFMRSGLAANRPTTGETVQAGSSPYYFATDTHVLSIWDGLAWRTTTLT